MFTRSHPGRECLRARAVAHFLAILLFVGATSSAGASGIVIVQKVESAGQAGEVTLFLQGNKARADLSPSVSLLIDGDTGEQVTLMHQPRTFMRITPDEGRRLARATKGEDESESESADRPEDEASDRPKLVPTGKKANVAGQNAEIYKFETGTVSATYWFSSEFPGYEEILASLAILQKSAAAGTVNDLMPSPVDFPGLPVKTVIEADGRKVTNTLISIAKRDIRPENFEIPDDYKSAYFSGAAPTPTPKTKAPAPRIP